MNIVLLGSPASGKGTQAELLAKKLKLYHFQTGGMSRQLAKTNDRIKKIVESGKLIPEQEMTMYVIDFLKEKHTGMGDILFEGFPRFISQYEALKDFLETKGDDIDAVISLDIGEEEAIKRLSNRRICDKCGEVYNLVTNPPPSEGACKCGGKLIQRKDDKPTSIKVRFQYYKDNTKKLIDHLDKFGMLIKIDGQRSIDEISKDIITRLKEENVR
jgi:adenylate kinase